MILQILIWVAVVLVVMLAVWLYGKYKHQKGYEEGRKGCSGLPIHIDQIPPGTELTVHGVMSFSGKPRFHIIFAAVVNSGSIEVERHYACPQDQWGAGAVFPRAVKRTIKGIVPLEPVT